MKQPTRSPDLTPLDILNIIVYITQPEDITDFTKRVEERGLIIPEMFEDLRGEFNQDFKDLSNKLLSNFFFNRSDSRPQLGIEITRSEIHLEDKIN